MKRKIFAGCAALLLAAAVSVSAFAAGGSTFLEGCSSSEEGSLQILCSDVAESAAAEEFTVTLSGTELSVLSVQTEAEVQTPVTWYCLVDVSGSISDEEMAVAKEALLAVAAGMGEGDNMVIGTLGNSTETSGFLTDSEEITAAIEALAPGNEDTNLYKGIVESIEILESAASVNPRKCLILLSDGQDDQKTGITQDEAEDAITESSIPVYTVALLDDTGDDDAVSYAKLLGSFARMSVGGDYYVPELDGITGTQAGESILADMDAKLVVTVDLTGASAGSSDEMLLRVSYTAADGTTYEDTMYLYTEDIAFVAEETEETVEEEESSAESETVGEGDSGDDSTVEPGISPMMIGILAAVIVVVIIILVLVLRKKKNGGNGSVGTDSRAPEEFGDGSEKGGATAGEQTQGESAADSGSGEGETSADSGIHSEETGVDLSGKNAVSPEGASGTGSEGVPFAPLPKQTEFYLCAVGYRDVVHKITLEEGKDTTIGRNAKADIVLDPKDNKLSGRHCRMKWEDGKLYIWDENSTNGTFVNGVPIKTMGRVRLKEGETVRIGSYEYRVVSAAGGLFERGETILADSFDKE